MASVRSRKCARGAGAGAAVTLRVVAMLAVLAVGATESGPGEVRLLQARMNIDAIMDAVLKGARSSIIASGEDEVDLPNIEEKFKKKLGPITVSGKFTADEGWLRPLSAVQRSGPADLQYVDGNIVINASLSLNKLELGYKKYKAKLGKVGPTGHLDAKVSSNQVDLVAGLRITSTGCALSVRALELSHLGKIKLHVTGLGALNGLYSSISSWVVGKFQGKIRRALNKSVRSAIEQAMLQVDCGKLLGFDRGEGFH